MTGICEALNRLATAHPRSTCLSAPASGPVCSTAPTPRRLSRPVAGCQECQVSPGREHSCPLLLLSLPLLPAWMAVQRPPPAQGSGSALPRPAKLQGAPSLDWQPAKRTSLGWPRSCLGGPSPQEHGLEAPGLRPDVLTHERGDRRQGWLRGPQATARVQACVGSSGSAGPGTERRAGRAGHPARPHEGGSVTGAQSWRGGGPPAW